MNEDESHLRLLSIFYYVAGALSAVFSCVFLLHVAWGFATVHGTPFFGSPTPGGPPKEFGIILMVMGSFAVFFGWAFGGCLVMAGRSIATRRRHLFCLVIAAIACVACNPIGIGLGVFTFIVLMRPSVKRMFGVT